MNMRIAILLSLISWGLMAFSFPPFPLGLGAFVFLAPWFYVLKTADKKVALVSSSLGAFLFNTISIYWLYHVGDVAPPALIFSGLFLAVAYLSLFTLLCAWVFVKIRDVRFGKFPLVCLFPFFWGGIEVLRAKGDMSFPWLSLGLVFGNSLELMQSFALFGVFGASMIIIASNMCLATADPEKKLRFFMPFILAAILYFGGYNVIEEDVPSTEDSLTVAVVQPSVPQAKKWSREYYDSIMKQTWGLFNTLKPDSVALILFAETAIPDFMDIRYSEQSFLGNYAAKHNSAIVIGALSRAWDSPKENKRNRKYGVYNSAFLFSSSRPMQEYRKMHLVPFSEKMPLDDIFPVINYVDLGGGDFSPGNSIYIWQPGDFSPLICYEAIYGNILREAKRKGAKFIANITNDGWFYKSIAPYQHFNLVRAHAVETGIGVVRAANTGISAFIAANGKIIEKTELFDQKIIVNKIPLATRSAPYYFIGDYTELVLFIFSLVMVVGVILFKMG